MTKVGTDMEVVDKMHAEQSQGDWSHGRLTMPGHFPSARSYTDDTQS